jgi:metallo-beta-lactamase family protein
VATITFLGAAGTVTGSRFLVETARARVLVDAGLFQGRKELRLRNWDPFPVPPSSIDAVVITHAHVDHVGYLPALVRDGFAGRAHATRDTIELSAIVLADSGHLQEEEAAYANRKGFSKHSPARPLYTEADALRASGCFVETALEAEREVAPGVFLTLHRAGHILGSAFAALRLADDGDRRIVFSGDLGRPRHPILLPPTKIGKADIIVVESTYGDRTHDDARAVTELRHAIVRAAARGGTVLIPAFAVDRTEVMLLRIRELMLTGAVPELPVYVDSPMALAALRVYRAAAERGEPEINPDVQSSLDALDPAHLIEVRELEASKRLSELRFPAIIVSASGMLTGGRVLHHLERLLPDPRNAVLLAGFQAPGTRGRLLADGAKQIKLLGRYVRVRADVVDLGGFSVHADGGEMVDWLETASPPPEWVFVVHGEPHASSALCDRIEERLDWNAVVPRHLERIRID